MISKPDTAFYKALRINALEITQVALRQYEKTGNEKYLEYAQWFQEKSNEFNV